jgi:hypothetical protein
MRIDWTRLPHIISSSVGKQLKEMSGFSRLVEVVRTAVFTSTRPDTPIEGLRSTMLADFHAANFELHRFITAGTQVWHQHGPASLSTTAVLFAIVLGHSEMYSHSLP